MFLWTVLERENTTFLKNLSFSVRSLSPHDPASCSAFIFLKRDLSAGGNSSRAASEPGGRGFITGCVIAAALGGQTGGGE